MEDSLKEYIENNFNEYIPIKNIQSLKKIHNLCLNKIHFNPETSEEFYYYGIYYYEDIEKDYDLMKKYYLMAIDLNNSCAMNNLGVYYQNIEKDYDLMKKYYLMAIELKNSYAMFWLGSYYEDIEDYDLMKKYYLMAIELNNSGAMNNLGCYYETIDKNYDLMKKYFLMAIELNDNTAMYNFGFYHEHIEKDYDLMKKYYLMAIELNNRDAMANLRNYYIDNDMLLEEIELVMTYPKMIERKILIESISDIFMGNFIKDTKKFIKLIMSFDFEETDNICSSLKLLINCLKSQMTIFELHFNYTLNGKGFEDAKNDFIERCGN